MPTVEILSQGDEVITGQVADTNAAWLSTRLTELGFTVTRHTSVGDHLEELQAVLGEIAGRCDLCIGTGGLGPTEDDLTAEAVARAFQMPLALDAQALSAIQEMYRRFGRVMPEANRKQAMLPSGSQRLDNHWGTAPGFGLSAKGTWFALLPGVPREMRAMFEEIVLPELAARFPVRPGRLVTIRTTGLGESNLQDRIGRWNVPDVALSFRTRSPENHIKLRFPPDWPEADVLALVGSVLERIGSSAFSVEGLSETSALSGVDTHGGELAEVIGRALLERGETLATAESCTGGRVGALLTAVAGSSAWFLEGAITYSNPSKTRVLGVPEALIAQHGAVSEPVARAMAEGVRAVAGSTYGLSATGIAGPGGGTPEKPVGTVHIALATPEVTHHRLLRLPGDRHRVQILAAAAVLDLLRRHLSQQLR